MRTGLRSASGAMLTFGLALALSGCPEDQKLPIGASCNSGDQCISGLCAGKVCLDPAGDDDGDTLINSLEQTLGSDPLNADTDGDGLVDGAELDGVSNVDTDGDGLADIVESATNDADGDCITDQYDAENDVQNADLSPMRDVVCSDLGVCAGQDRGLFGVLCPEGAAVCDYSNVVGFADPESECDGVDENCDGAADEGYPDQDDDGIADCVDPDFDNDGVDDAFDNCPLVANQDQADAQDDRIGDACADDYTLAFTLAPTLSVIAGARFDVAAALRDDTGNIATRFRGEVTLTLLVDNGGAATLGGKTTVNAVDGIADFSDLVVSPAAANLALIASSGDLASGTSESFDAVAGDLAELRATAAPPSVVAGDALTVTLTAWDAFDNVLTSWLGTVTFSATDPLATLPDDYTYLAADAGAHTFDTLVFRTAGEHTVTVSDAATDAVLATFDVTVDNAPADTFGVTGLPATLTAGAATTLTVTARDPFGNVADDYAGTARFSVDDDAATVPGDHLFVPADAGVFQTSALVVRTAGAHTLGVSDGDDDVTATVDFTVVHGEPAALVVTAEPAPFIAGAPFTVTVTVVDAFGNVATGFTGTVALSSSDPLATLPAAYTFTAADLGVHVFTGVTLVSSGDHSIAAASSGGITVSGGVAVAIESGADVVFVLAGVPSPATAGAPFDVALTVEGTFGNVVTDYVGTVALLSSDDAAELPAPLALTAASAGTGTFSGVVLKTAGPQTITAADSEHGVSQSANVTVQAGAAASLGVTGPSSVTAGTPFQVTVTARDAYGNPATGYTATLAFATSDDGATLPGDGTLPAGTGSRTFSGLALTDAGPQTVTVSDPTNGALVATLELTVSPASAASVALSGAPASAVAGGSIGLTATLYDSFGNVATGYTGQLAITTSDAAGVVPAAHTFTAGDAGAFAFSGIALQTAGQQTVTAAAPGNGALTASATVNVTPASAATLVVTPSDPSLPAGVTTSVLVRANDAFGNRATGYTGTVGFASSDGQATLPTNYAFTGADAGQHVFGGVVFRTVGAQSVTVTDAATATITGQATVTVAQGAQIIYELSGLPPSTQAGAALTATISVKDTFGNPITSYTGTVAFTALDAETGAPVGGATLPSSYTFVGADQGSHTFTGIILTKARTTTVRAAEVGSTGVSASAVVNVTPAGMSRLAIQNAPAAVTAGTAFGLTVTAYDAWDNVATAYTGPVSFSASRLGATLPSDGTLTAGTRSFSGLVLTLAGDTIVTVTGDDASTDVTLPVGHATAAALDLTALPATVAAGASQSLTATIKDSWGNVATGFTGSATVVTNDPDVPATSLDFLAVHQGTRTLTVTFETVGSRQVTVDAGGPLSATRSTTVTPAGAASFQVSTLPGQVTAGTAQSLTITLYDAYGNVATGGYAGGFTIGATDGAAALVPSTLTIGAGDSGTRSFTATLVTAGEQTVTVTQTTLGTVDRTTTVRAAAAHHVTVTDLPPTVVAGVDASVVVRIADAFGNTVSNYGGIVAVSSSDAAVSLAPGASLTFPANQPASVTLTATFETAGTQSLDFLDTGLGAGGVDATPTLVNPAAARDLVATPPTGGAVAGTGFTFTVAIYDAFGNLATGYTGTVSFSSSDPLAALPAATQYTAIFAGTHDFSATLRTAGTQSITATGTGLTGATSDAIQRVVAPSSTLDHLGVVPSLSSVPAGQSFSATVTPYDAWNNVITSFSGSVTMSVDDLDGSVPSPIAMSGATQVTPIVLYAASTTPHLVTATYDTIEASGAVTVVPAGPDHLGFSTQPTAGFVATPLPTFRVAVYDEYGNVATNLAATPVTLTLGRNAGPGHLGGTLLANTASGVAAFSAAQLDRPGQGYDLIATATVGSARSDRFDVTWRPATLVGTPFLSGGGGCRDVHYTLAQANAHRSDVLIEYRVGTGPWLRATQAPGSAPATDGTRAVATSVAGVAHSFRWDAFADLGANDAASVTARVTPVSDGVAGIAKTTTAFSANFAWSTGYSELPLTGGVNPGPLAVGDYDRNGLDDLLVIGRDAAYLDVFYQTAPGTFTEVVQQVDLPELATVAVRPWQASPNHTLGFFLLSQLDSRLFVFSRSVQGVGAVGWSYMDTYACPAPATNMPVAMAVADISDVTTLDVVVACNGDGGTQPPSVSIIVSNGQGWLRGRDITLAKRPTALEVADLGHDGRRDIIVGDSNGLATLINVGDDSFCQTAACGAQVIDMPVPKALAVVDLDADGQLDVIAVHGDETASVVFGDVVYGPQGNPLQFLAPQVIQLPLSIAATTVAAGDVSSDGRIDVVVGSSEGDQLEILLGSDLASWRVIDTGAAAGGGPNSLWIGDLNSDGMTDVVAGREDPDAPTIAWVAGKGFQQCRPSFETASAARYMIESRTQVPVDNDRDGRLDTFWRTASESVTQGLVVGYGDGTGGYLRTFGGYATGFAPVDMAVGDLDGDGLMDAVLSDSYTDNVHVVLQDPDAPGSFDLGYAPTYFADANVDSLVIANVDNDGFNDLVFLGEDAFQPYYGTADTLQAGAKVGLGGYPRGLGLADVNKDGYQDLAFYRYSGNFDNVCILLSTGPRVWESPTGADCILVGSGGGRVNLVDLDGDGVEEMVYADDYTGDEPTLIEIRRQEPPDSGRFGPPEELPSCQGAGDVRFSDVDGDGRTDMLISCGADGGASPYGVLIVRQAADGSFGSLQSGFGTYSWAPWGLGISDMDGDHFDDVTRAGTTTLHAKAGSSFVTPSSAPASDGSSVNLLAAADLDRDGLTDAVTAGGQRFYVILQVEPGKFAAPVGYTVPGIEAIYGLAVADVDGDDRPDVVVGVNNATGKREVRVFGQTLPATYDVVNGFTALSPTGTGYPYVLAIDDIAGVGAASVLVSQASFVGQDEFDVFLQGNTGAFTKVRSDPYTSAFPSPVVAAGFGWFGHVTYREPFVAGRCGSVPCIVVAQLGACDIPGTICYKTKTAVSLGGGAAAPLYTDLTGAVAADLDRDGFHDLVASLTGANGLHVYAVLRQSPTKPGDFLPMQTFTGAHTTAAGPLRLADIDHDGRLDIIAQYDGGTATGYEVLLGRGDGTTFGDGFAVATALADYAGGFAVGDFDQDGWSDLLTLDPSAAELLLAPQR